MNDFVPFQERYVRAVEHLVASPLVSVGHQEAGEDPHDGAGADAVLEELAESSRRPLYLGADAEIWYDAGGRLERLDVDYEPLRRRFDDRS